ncbi:hypothetical protein SCLCIDRAFT_28596 [Scleroderma citrinum Foug A]|uniref:Uncharacterized protein n=1 Tax=Scleroderma citrinum Foug A TaxID=1036808 RepID=A0A0C3DAI7_9AGAM|nr:hypothetical protein SCLCIDRAFT_28596 [Scleroderma citrinum Foug A]
MSTITWITHVETTTAIWEFVPSLSENQVLGDSLDIVAAIQTLVIKIQASGQRIAYFNNMCWGMAAGMLGQAYDVQRPINLFISFADQLFGPITSVRHPGQPIKHIPWIAFTLKTADLEHVNDMQTIISDTNKIQHLFSSDDQLALWCAIPAIKEFQTTWETKHNLDKYMLYKVALNHCHAPNTFGTVNMEDTIDSRLSWSEQ